MDLTAVLRVALRALARNKMRTSLTMLGIIIGVGAVISTVAIGEGASNQVQEALRNMGDNIVFVAAGSVNQHGVQMGSSATKTLTLADAKAMQQQIQLLTRVSPGVGAAAQIVYGNQNWYTRLRGVGPEYLDIRRWPLQEGSDFSQREVDTAAEVCLIGLTVAQNLFGEQNTLGKTIRVQNLPFRIIGVLASKGQSPFGQDEDDTIIMPFTTVQKKLMGVQHVANITVSAENGVPLDTMTEQISALLRTRHRIQPGSDDDFLVRTLEEMASVLTSTTNTMTYLLAGIAAVSLIVGGIGIMNIMLVSVTERTREIGLRMAVGATEEAVRMQFLSEALVLSLFGGTLGVFVGILGSTAVSKMLQWPTEIPPEAIAIAVLFSAAVGIFFGYYPARKAAHLDPIEALRYE